MPAKTIGAFTEYVARLSELGELVNDADGNPESVSDTYTVLVPVGIRPTLANVTGLPSMSAAHASGSNLHPTGVRFACESKMHGVWKAVVDYARADVVDPGEEEEADTRITARSWDTVEAAQDLITDAETGVPVLNAAGDPFDSVPQVPRCSPKVGLTMKTSRAPATFVNLSGTVNSAAITVLGQTFPAYCARLKVSVIDTMATTGFRYEVNIEIEGRVNQVKIGEAVVNVGWREAFIECGYQFLKDGKRYKFTEKTKNTAGEEEEKEVSSPQLLTATGDDGRGAAPVVKIVNAHRSASWAVLNLPS